MSIHPQDYQGVSYKVLNGTWYHIDTPDDLCHLLETLRQQKNKVRLFYGDPFSGRVWLGEHDVVGRVGRSMGPVKTPLLVLPRSDSGSVILTPRLLAIQNDRLDFLYRHPRFTLPELTKHKVPVHAQTHGLVYEVCRHDKAPHDPDDTSTGLQARFHTEADADQYIAFFKGTALSPQRRASRPSPSMPRESYFVIDDAIDEAGREGFVLMHGNPTTAVGVDRGAYRTLQAAREAAEPHLSESEVLYRVFLARRHGEHKVKPLKRLKP